MKSVPTSEARAHLSRLVQQASSTNERYEITRNGSRAAVLISANDYDAMIETKAVLSDTKLVKDIRRGLLELSRGAAFTVDQVRADMRTVPPKSVSPKSDLRF